MMENKKEIYYVIDARRSFIDELETACIMSMEEFPFEVKTLRSMDGIENIIRDPNVKRIIIAQNILENYQIHANLNVPYYCYLENEAGWKLAKDAGLKSYGILEEPKDLLEVIDKEPEKKSRTEKKPQESKMEKPEKTTKNMGNNQTQNRQQPPNKYQPYRNQGRSGTQKGQQDISGRTAMPEREKPQKKTTTSAPPKKEFFEPSYEEALYEEPKYQEPFYEEPEDKEMDVFESDFDEYSIQNDTREADMEQNNEMEEMDILEDYTDDPEEDDIEELDNSEEEYMEHASERNPKTTPRNSDRDSLASSRSPKKDTFKSKTKTKVYEDEAQERQFMEDIGRGKHAAKVVTVYSAKGGVGKTTVAAEIATYLALVTRGRSRLRVCIVDYNIDFGDVGTTLAIPKKGVNLSYWAEEVREYLKSGKSPEEIVYTKEDIEAWLRKDEESGLYILPAPLTNEDSSEITGVELDVILNNLKQNGEFDYIICDTGNNTRSTTMSAIEFADMILMIVDQNINTASCDERFINTMKFLEFDLAKTRMVVNRIMPKRMTTISVQELLEYFPFECVGKLKFSSDVIKATNIGKPLVISDPDNEFVKQMKEIVAYILDDDSFREEVPKKKSFFAKLFSKK